MWLDYKEMGRRAKDIRETLGDSQDDMAERIGMERGSGARIGKLERGQLWRKKGQSPEPRMLEAIARAGSLTLEHFRTGEVQNLERQEKLAVLRWLNKVAADLQKEVGAIPTSVGDFVGDVEAESVRPSMARGKKGGDGRP